MQQVRKTARRILIRSNLKDNEQFQKGSNNSKTYYYFTNFVSCNMQREQVPGYNDYNNYIFFLFLHLKPYYFDYFNSSLTVLTM